MAIELTPKQEGFARDYLETGNGTKAVLDNYDTSDENTAAVISSENLRKPKIREYLESNAEHAAERIVVLSISAENETVRLNANKDILDRAGYKPTEHTDITSKGEQISNTVLPELIAQADSLLKERKLNQ